MKKERIHPGFDSGLRCKFCGHIQSFVVMFTRTFAKQKDARANYVYVECNACGRNEYVLDPIRAHNKVLTGKVIRPGGN